MAQLSNLELYLYAQEKYDKYNSPLITYRAFQWMYSEARLEWMRNTLKNYETVEQARIDLLPFNREKDYLNTKRIGLNQVTDKILARTAVWADFEFECNGTTEIYTMAVKPISRDEAAVTMTDPFNQPTDEFPYYLDKNDGEPYLEILSTTVPKVVTLSYVKTPRDYRLIEDPDGFTEEQETQQLLILDLSVKKVELTIENFAKFQAMREEIQTNG